MFLSPTNALLYYTYKMLKYTVKISHKLHGTQYTPQFETLFTNIAEYLTTYFYCNFSKVRHRLPDDGPNGPKHVGAIMRYFNCIF